MADDDGASNPFLELQAKLAQGRKMVIIALSVAAITAVVALLVIWLLYQQLSALQAADDRINTQCSTLQVRAQRLDESIDSLVDFRQDEMRRMAYFADQLRLVKEQCASGVDGKLQVLLVDREKQVQGMLQRILNGTEELANMTLGSRAWLDGYREAIQQFITDSKAREQELQNFASGQPNNVASEMNEAQ